MGGWEPLAMIDHDWSEPMDAHLINKYHLVIIAYDATVVELLTKHKQWNRSLRLMYADLSSCA